MEAKAIGAKGLARATGAKAVEKARAMEAKARARAHREETEIGPVIIIGAMKITGDGITANFLVYSLDAALA